MQIKVAIVISNMTIGGAQKVVVDTISAMNREKVNLKLFVHNKEISNQFVDKLKELNIVVEFIPRTERISLRNFKRLFKAVNSFCPDLVHIHLDTLYAPIYSLLYRKKAIFTIHSQPYRLFNKKLTKLLFKTLIKSKLLTICGVSNQISKEAKEILNLDTGVVKTIYNPVQTVPFQQHIKNDPFKFINVARFNPIKNHYLLIDSFEIVSKKYENAELVLAGDGELIESCKARVQKLGLKDKVRFLGNANDVYSLLKKSDVFVLSSDSEAMPISVLEAMACSLPVIATSVGGVPELVNNNGILVDKGDVEQFSNAMLRMLNDDSFRNACSMESYKKSQEFAVDIIAENYLQLYLQV